MNPAEQSLAFFQAIFGGKPREALITIWTLPDKATRRFESPEDAAKYCQLREGYDCYVGVGLQGYDLGMKDRGKATDVVGITAMWADIDLAGPGHKDTRKEYPPDLSAVGRMLKDFTAPTVAVHSGHGLHLWWALDRPWMFADATDRARAAESARQWSHKVQAAAALRGWDVDSVHDLARVLRVPGTRNYKDQANPAEVTLVWP